MLAVTGAAGFIGSNLAHRLAAEGYELLLVDHPLTGAKAANLVGLSSFRFLEHQIFLAALDNEIRNLEAVFHLGACSSTTETDWGYLERNNIEYSKSLWSWCARHNCPFLYASSAATYGDGSRGFDDRTPPSEFTPLNLYGRSKNDFDIWATNEVETARPSPPKWAGLKFFNVYGPRESHKGRMASIVFHAWQQIRSSGTMKLFRSNHRDYRDGEQLRDFVFVEDCLDHLLWLWRNRAPNGLYNSGTGTARSFLDLTNAIFEVIGREPVVQYIEMPDDLGERYQYFTQAVMTKFRGIGFNGSVTPFKQGISETVRWLETQ